LQWSHCETPQAPPYDGEAATTANHLSPDTKLKSPYACILHRRFMVFVRCAFHFLPLIPSLAQHSFLLPFTPSTPSSLRAFGHFDSAIVI
jgi:hypothetical protein